MKSILNMLLPIVAMKILVLFGVLSSSESSIPLSLKINLKTGDFETEINKSGYIKYDCEIVNGKAKINNYTAPESLDHN